MHGFMLGCEDHQEVLFVKSGLVCGLYQHLGLRLGVHSDRFPFCSSPLSWKCLIGDSGELSTRSCPSFPRLGRRLNEGASALLQHDDTNTKPPRSPSHFFLRRIRLIIYYTPPKSHADSTH